ncbi:hypothetical protein C2G38_2158370 [Gigaspora rosea]|uniref:Uncharacterized protein n=1 Tax=Gigaspora rosea TaxID=44941 RepID=A0A397W0H9_9GLOM|nr:hypothetical protein C2G38_2158370 [Gigaspora rosea]
MSSEPAESQIAAVIEEFFKNNVIWSLIKYLRYRKEAEDFTYSKRKELRLYRSSLKVLPGDENNKEKKKMPASRKEERAHCSDTSHTIPPLQQSESFNNGYNTPSPHGYTTPLPHSSVLNNSLVEPPMLVDRINNPFIAEDEVDDIFIIDDVNDLCFIDGNSVDNYKIEETNVSHLFLKYQNNSINIAKTGAGYFFSDSHSRKMIDIFGSPLLDTIYQRIILTQQTALDSDCEAKFKNAIKRATKESFSNATDWLMAELSNNKPLKDNIGFMNLNYNPGLWTTLTKNTGFNESKARKSEGRSKQPDFVVSAIHQLQICGVIFVGEVNLPLERNNVYKNCRDLISVGIS